MKIHTDDYGNEVGASSEVQPLIQKSYNKDYEEPVWKQYLAAFLASLISFSTGCVAGWSSPAVPRLLTGNASDIGGIKRLTIEEVSWVASLINLGAFFGSVPAGYLSFRFGRKISLLILAVPIIVGWLFIIFNGNNVWCLYIGRFITGISYGSLNVALPIYNNEVCCDRIRGRIGIMYDLMQSVGLLWVYLFGAFLSLFWITNLCLMVPIIFLITFIWMPESPLYLLRNGKKEEAIKAIKWLHGENCNIDSELSKIHQALLEGQENIREKTVEFTLDSDSECENGTYCCSPLNYILDFYYSLSKVTIKAILIAFFMFVLQRTCGATMVQYYADNVFNFANSSIPSNWAAVIMGIISVIFSFISAGVVDTLGRRFLLTFTFSIMTVSMIIFIGYLVSVLPDITSTVTDSTQTYYRLIPSVSLCVFVAMFRLGVSPVPWFMAPEIIPTEAQKWAPSAIVCITWGISFLLSKSFLPAIQKFGQVSVYTFFMVVCAIGVIYTWIFVPETKNKSREQIQRELGAITSSYEAI